jgi:uncharacterized protein YjbI with pentapeptide repeats
VSLLLLIIFADSARADVFQWEYVNPADASQGKRQSTTLAPDGAGVDAMPAADLSNRDLTMAYLIGSEVQNASFYRARLTDADFTSAVIRGASFRPRSSTCSPFCGFLSGTGITIGQIYSTASYHARDLNGIDVSFHDMTGVHFVRQNLANANLEAATFNGADFRGANLSGVIAERTKLVGANFRAANLTAANLREADLTGANLNGAELMGARIHGGALTLDGPSHRGANLSSTTSNGFTAAQLYSTASYQDRNLSSIRLGSNDLTGWNFAGQNLVFADFGAATLHGADLSQTYLASAYLFGADLAGANLSGARIHGWTYEFSSYQHIPGAYFTSATSDGFTADQLYSTASYQARDLTRIGLGYNDMSDWDFADQNLRYANFEGATLTGADLSRANLTNAIFTNAALTGADFNAADARGASLDASDAITTNLIRPNGHIHGLDSNAGGLLVVREYRLQHDSSRKIPIMVDEHVIMGPGGALRMVFEADAWDSTISFAPGIPVTLGGTLELAFAADVNLAGQIGRTFKLFDWTGVTPTGAFTVSSPYAWDLSNLYTTGEVTLTAIPEPGSVALASAGAIGLAMYRRRKRP